MTNSIKPNVQKQDCQLGFKYDMSDIYKLRHCININWDQLSVNPNAIDLLKTIELVVE